MPLGRGRKGKFQDFAQRTALKKELSDFADACSQLREVARMKKHDSEAQASKKKDQKKHDQKDGGAELPNQATVIANHTAYAFNVHGNSTIFNFEKCAWVVDSGCSHHMTPSTIEFTAYSPLASPMLITVANGDRMTAIGKGTVSFDNEMPDGTTVTSTVDDVLYVPQLAIGLLSVSALIDKGAQVT